MILGIFNRNKDEQVFSGRLRSAFASGSETGEESVCCHGFVGLAYCSPFKTNGYAAIKPIISKETGLAVLFSGMIYNRHELIEMVGWKGSIEADLNQTELISLLYQNFGTDLLEKINGKFVLAIYDFKQRKLYVARDRMGIEPLYYYADAKYVVISSTIHNIFRYTGHARELNPAALGKFLLFNYNPGLETLFKKINKLRSAHLLVADDENLTINPYWRLSFKPLSGLTETQICDLLLEYLTKAVKIRMDHNDNPGIFLSGGMDSSTIAALASCHTTGGLRTFSYRCQSESFDESHYASLMAASISSEHSVEQYREADIFEMPKIVNSMNEPFCDVGINIASVILGRQAAAKVNYVFTGDGGDELFGGHPVYEADKIASYFDLLPKFIAAPLSNLLATMPDSNKKKNLAVKLKRFSESVMLPAELLSHRWRIYYQPGEIKRVLRPAVYEALIQKDLYADILTYNREADGKDLLSKSLYSDYQTAVDFYLRRNDLNRAFEIETRYPMLDHQLVEFCASIPAKQKIKGWFDTKYILKKTMEKILPADIVYRKDKLGHSIPLKNWMRDNNKVRDFILDHISEKIIKQRGLFNPSYVSALIEEHMNKKQNNSHRLWALAVLEMWFQLQLDRSG